MAGMAAVTETDGLALHIEWETAHGVTAAELAATWCRLEIRVGTRTVTAVEDSRSSTIRRSVYTSAYPLAEWIAEHWWSLRSHVRPSALPRSAWTWSRRPEQPWLGRHNLRAAGGGMPWPDLTIVPEGSTTRLVWNASRPTALGAVDFLTSGDVFLPSAAVMDSLGRFVETVLLRLDEAGVSETPLQQEWALLQSSDDDENAFAAALARLGGDPFDVPSDLADDVISISEEVDEGFLHEFLDSAVASEVSTAWTWVGRARASAVGRPRPRLDTPIEWLQSHLDSQASQPWSIGYAVAQAYRRQLELAELEVFAPDEYVATTTVDAPAGGLQGLVGVQGGEAVSLVLPAELSWSATSKRFAQARSLALSLLTSRDLLLLDPAATDLAKASRACAAELLAPAGGIADYLSALPDITSAALEAVAARFDVSPLLVQHQVENQLQARIPQ